jgi:hypothetical protein
MGYRSEVAITLMGEENELKDLLNAYRLSETTDQIEAAWHLLGDNPDNDQVKFFYEEIDANDPIVQMTWHFKGVKWYEESERALSRLGEILDEMQGEADKYKSLAIVFQRLGENQDDYGECHWGEDPFGYENPVDAVRYFEVQAPVVEVNPIKQLYSERE